MKIKVISVTKNKSGGAGTLLVEWHDPGENMLYRGYVPEEIVVNGEIEDESLSLAIPYGVDWDYAISSFISTVPQDIVRELKRRGLWTTANIRANPELVHSALQQAYSVDIQTIIRLAKDYEEVTNG